MLNKISTTIFGSQNQRVLKKKLPLVERVNSLEPEIQALADAELAGKTIEFRQRLDNGEELDALMPEAFAVVREAAVRALGMRHFDVQLIGGSVLHEGKIAEMKTGEGKTLVATLPVYLNALVGRGVHVVTVNDYLARRDAEWMGQVYSFLGLSTGIVLNGMSREEKLAAYRADITYGQNNEFGFDYLRDNMKIDLEEVCQRDHYFAIVDEVDSILIDEARTPLIISGAIEDATELYHQADKVVPHLKFEEHYTLEEKNKQVNLNEAGVAKVEELFGIENLYDMGNISYVHHINNALRAHVVQKKDIDYVVRDGKVIIVDEFTGRLMDGRRWSDGLHQAVEAKEGVRIAEENQTLASITFQNYFRMYDKLSGMTGTADTEAVEFKKIYNLDVVVVPTNKPIARADNVDVVFTSEEGKYKAVCNEIEQCHKNGQPVLVGTASIARSELLSSILTQKKVPHHVLNAKQHEREAEIVAQAGRVGSVTIATNMAGRGTDIVLGGNPEFLAADELEGVEDEAERERILAGYREVCEEEKKKVLELGGLHIIGTERHESRRIDNQLRGRSGRQGDPGSSRFYVSLQDDLMRRFGGEKIQAMMSRFGMAEDDAIEGRIVGRAIENAQKKVEEFHLGFREQLLKFDNVMNQQREVVYKLRGQIIKGEGIEEEIDSMIPEVLESMILTRIDEKEPVNEWPVETIIDSFNQVFGAAVDKESWVRRRDEIESGLAQSLYDELYEVAKNQLEARNERFGKEVTERNAKVFFLQAINHFWREHLSNMDHLKEGIGLRGYGQRDPLREYQSESYALFSSMMIDIRQAVLMNLFNSVLLSEEEVRAIEEAEREKQREREAQAEAMHQNFGSSSEGDEASGPNRAQRRRQKQGQPNSDGITARVDVSKAENLEQRGGEDSKSVSSESKNAKKRKRKKVRSK